MYPQTEFTMDREAKKFFYKFLYNTAFINGQKGKDPVINYHYFRLNGTKKEFQKAKENLEEYNNLQKKVANILEKEAKKRKNIGKKICQVARFNGVWLDFYIEEDTDTFPEETVHLTPIHYSF